MHTSPFDFVSALSAEELCPVCRELHAAVDECLCSFCQTHVCRDCSTLQPDTTWICTSCVELVPPRAYPLVARSRWSQLNETRHAMREQSELWLRELGPASARLLAFVRTSVVALLAWSRPALARAQAQSLVALTNLSVRLQQLLIVSRARSARRLRLLGSTRRLLISRLKIAGRVAQRKSVAFVHSVRTLPVRGHTTSLLIATMILIAVARAENDAS